MDEEYFFNTTEEFIDFLENKLELGMNTRKKILEEEVPHYEIAKELGYCPRYVATKFYEGLKLNLFRFSVSIRGKVSDKDKIKILSAPRIKSPQDYIELKKLESKIQNDTRLFQTRG